MKTMFAVTLVLQVMSTKPPWTQSITTRSNVPLDQSTLSAQYSGNFPRFKTRTTSPIYLRSNKPGAGLGWTEPRNESSLGLVDRRLHLQGYIGGVKKRDSKFAEK